jgi:hypothetical protein
MTMTSLTVPHPPEAPGQTSVSPERGGLREVAPLDPFLYQRMRWCGNCGGEQVFVEVFECEAGRMGFCMGCGNERVIPFSRTNSEAC